ncbi:MAG: hypothetical protein M1274_07995 [Actinobacteria bacterium]|nr:hypothetical protein [Actinomycetota bacterium]
MWIVKSSRVRGVLIGLFVVILALVLAGCGGSEETTTTAAPATTTTAGTGSSTPVTFTGDAATIAANFEKFFDGSQPVAGKADLLENGSQYTKELEAQAASPLAQAATCKVTDVQITSSTTADVTFTLLVGGTPALQNQKGQAVLQDGTWKVSAATFQALLALQGATTPTTTQ